VVWVRVSSSFFFLFLFSVSLFSLLLHLLSLLAFFFSSPTFFSFFIRLGRLCLLFCSLLCPTIAVPPSLHCVSHCCNNPRCLIVALPPLSCVVVVVHVVVPAKKITRTHTLLCPNFVLCQTVELENAPASLSTHTLQYFIGGMPMGRGGLGGMQGHFNPAFMAGQGQQQQQGFHDGPRKRFRGDEGGI